MTENPFKLVIGSKEGSSWSLRPWILLRQAGIDFEEVVITLRQPDTAANIAKHSPSGQVPVLHHRGRIIWDSMAIAEYVNERCPEASLWPADEEARAHARCISAEMHSSFKELRYGLPMEFSKRGLDADLNDQAKADVRRVVIMLGEARRRFGAGGPFLYGAFSAADAMFAPVASRFTSFNVDLARHGDGGAAETWRGMMMALPHMIDWGTAARAENMPRWKA